nr:hypothetical protein [Tanacetum cinerariifolium]
MARLLFCDYHNMVAILEKGEHNIDFHPMVGFLEASPLGYALTVKPTVYVSHLRQFWSTARIETTEEGTKIVATVDGTVRTVSESSFRRNLKLRDKEGISSLPDVKLFENLTLMGYNISPNQKTYNFSKMIFNGRVKNVNNKVNVSKGEGSSTPTEPHHTPSPEAQTPSHTTHLTSSLPPVTTISIPTVTPTETTPIRHYTRRTRIAQSFVPPTDRATIAKSSTLPYGSAPRVTSSAAGEGTQEVEINRLKEKVKLLEEREGAAVTNFRDDSPIKGRSMDEGEAVAERVSDDIEEMATVLTSMDAATVLARGVVNVPTSSGSIPTASTPAEGSVPTGSEEVPTTSPVFATATVVTPYRRRKGKEVMVESETPKKQKIAKDAEIARIHAEEELQSMIDGLDSSNETVATYLEEYCQFSSELPMERRIELISDLVKYQDNNTKVYKFQSQQRKSWTKKQKRDYYMAVIKNNLGWKVKDFKVMTFEEVEAKFNSVCKQMEYFIYMGSKEEAERIKRKCINLEQESAKKQKSSEDITEEAKPPEEVTKEKIKEMMQLVPIEEVYMEALQFFIDLLKHLDREDLNQLWRLVKEILSTRPPTSDKEMELWVELSRLYELDKEDQLWTHTQNFMHAPVDWKLYGSCGVHHVTSKDKEIFMLVENDYPLRNGLALVMICYKLQVENFSHIANDLVLKIYKIANSPRQQGERISKKGQNQIKTEQKREAWQSREISSSKVSRDQTSNSTSSMNPTPKGRIRRSSKQKVENSHFEEYLTPVATMTDNRTMAEILRAPTEGCAEAIVVPLILADQFELKHSLINMMTSEQFFGLEKDNPYDHVRWDSPPVARKRTPASRFLECCCRWQFVGKNPQDALTIIENKSKVCNSRSKPIASPVNACDINSSSEIAKLTHAVNQQTSVVTTAITAMLKQLQANPPSAQVKAVEEICVTCGANVQNNQNQFGQPQGFNRSTNFNQEQPYQATTQSNQNFHLNELEKIKRMNDVSLKAMQNQIDMVKNELRNEMKTSIQTSLSNQTNEIKNMMASLLQMNTASTSGSGSLPGNTVANSKGELKSITTRSGLVTDGPTVPTPPKSVNPEEEKCVEEMYTDPDLA